MRSLLVTAALAALVAGGCGGSGNDKSSDSSNAANPDAPFPTSATPPATKKEYIAQADAACAAFRQRLQALPQPKSAKDVGSLYDKIAKEAQEFYDSFTGIPKPKEGAQLLARYEKNLTQSIDITKKAAAAIKAGDTKGVEKLFKRTKQLQLQDRAIAKKFGFQVCGGTAAGG
jgi:hypothetical protein